LRINLLKYWEHLPNTELTIDESLGLTSHEFSYSFPKKRGNDLPCFSLKKNLENKYNLSTGYYVGLDWLEEENTALFVAPKINTKANTSSLPEELVEIDFIKMLFSAIKNQETFKEIDELFIIKWDKPHIAIEQKQDLLTPLLVVQFLGLLKTIVRKGLKKSYYRIENNIQSRVKGKILVGKTIKENTFKNKSLYTYCNYDEFGVNNKENRLLKKTLVFVKRYLPSYANITNDNYIQDTYNYISPAFIDVSEEIELNDIKQTKVNAFYKEYEQAIKLAKLILKRFSYNISNTETKVISTPPFWVDMPKLFELYVLSLLKNRFNHQVKYHLAYRGSELDYILKTPDYKMVIDAKYKLKYITDKHDEDIRQVSGYARLKNVYTYLEKNYPESIECLIVYPDQNNGNDDLMIVELNSRQYEIPQYHGVFKVGIKLPLIN
jgi:5-methylcytosine-specific restriction enzyme subunit McrC